MGSSLLAGIDPGPLALWASVAAGGDSAARIATVEGALRSSRGPYWRGEIGKWIGRLVPVETLVPESAQRWSPLVRGAFHFDPAVRVLSNKGARIQRPREGGR